MSPSTIVWWPTAFSSTDTSRGSTLPLVNRRLAAGGHRQPRAGEQLRDRSGARAAAGRSRRRLRPATAPAARARPPRVAAPAAARTPPAARAAGAGWMRLHPAVAAAPPPPAGVAVAAAAAPPDPAGAVAEYAAPAPPPPTTRGSSRARGRATAARGSSRARSRGTASGRSSRLAAAATASGRRSCARERAVVRREAPRRAAPASRCGRAGCRQDPAEAACEACASADFRALHGRPPDGTCRPAALASPAAPPCGVLTPPAFNAFSAAAFAGPWTPCPSMPLQLDDAHALGGHGHHHAGEARLGFAQLERVHRLALDPELLGEVVQPIGAADLDRVGAGTRARNTGSTTSRSISLLTCSVCSSADDTVHLLGPEPERAARAAAPSCTNSTGMNSSTQNPMNTATTRPCGICAGMWW